MKLGRRIFYDKTTGNIILAVERHGDVVATTVDQDILTYAVLSKRNRETFDVLELPFGAYAQDFAEATGFRVNVATKALEFSYPDPSNQTPAEPVYQRPLTDQVSELRAYTQQLNEDFAALAEFVTNGGV